MASSLGQTVESMKEMTNKWTAAMIDPANPDLQPEVDDTKNIIVAAKNVRGKFQSMLTIATQS